MEQFHSIFLNKLRVKKNKSKTPRSKSKKGQLSFIGSNRKHLNNRSSTTAGFYPGPLNNNQLNISPSLNKQIKKTSENFRSYSTIERNQDENEDRSAEKRLNHHKEQQVTFKINPSPYKRKECSIDELMNRLNTQLNELERMEAKELKKHLQAIKSRSKNKKKQKQRKKKARSHSPQEIASRIQRMMSIRNNLKNNMQKSIQEGNITEHKEKERKPIKGNIHSRNKKNNQSSIEAENRILKVKTITNIKNQGSKKNKGKKNLRGKKKNSKKNSTSNFIKDVKQKMAKAVKTKNEIYNTAAIIIQRWYRNIGKERRERQIENTRKKGLEKEQSGYPNPRNKDIMSLRSNQDVLEKRVIIDIHTGDKNENYHRNDKGRKR